MSKADTIAAAIATRLQTIRIANGYATDAGAAVYRGRTSFDAADVPCITIAEPEDEIEEQRDHPDGDGADLIARLPFTIEAFAACNPDAPNVAGHQLVADIKRAIFSADITLGGLAVTLRYLGRTIAPREPGARIVTVAVKIRVGYTENLAAP
ncbi:hypothetical protein [Aromatoleum aromaticum]|uniref:hypothetical protein n=1 Tax=Aromatoleum aromaticum TaxID=551760 RepID=UPI0002F98FF5|nr:hypothetical protein [Aromatoleum aromaticum]